MIFYVPEFKMANMGQKLRLIELVITDIDGVLTDGTLFFDKDGEYLKAFHVQDGLGIKLLINHGVDVAVISSRPSSIVQRRMEELGVKYISLGQSDKILALEDL